MKPYELTGEKLKAYRRGFLDGNELHHYYPAGLHEASYKWGYRDGQKYGPRKGKPWTLKELHDEDWNELRHGTDPDPGRERFDCTG
jgi:hypothetical protein